MRNNSLDKCFCTVQKTKLKHFHRLFFARTRLICTTYINSINEMKLAEINISNTFERLHVQSIPILNNSNDYNAINGYILVCRTVTQIKLRLQLRSSIILVDRFISFRYNSLTLAPTILFAFVYFA